MLTLLRECGRIWYALQKECKPAGPKMLSNTTDIKLPLLPRGWGGEAGEGGRDSLKKFTGILVKKMKKILGSCPETYQNHLL